MCTAKDISIRTACEAKTLPAMALPHAKGLAYTIRTNYSSSSFIFFRVGLALDLEQLETKIFYSIDLQQTEDQVPIFVWDTGEITECRL